MNFKNYYKVNKFLFKFYLFDDNLQEFAAIIKDYISKWEDKNCCFIIHSVLDKTIFYINLEWKKYNRQFKKFLNNLKEYIKAYCFDTYIYKEAAINLKEEE